MDDEKAQKEPEVPYRLKAKGRIEGSDWQGNRTTNAFGVVDGARLQDVNFELQKVIVRVDHSTIPGFWLEIDLSLATLKTFLSEQAAEQQQQQVAEDIGRTIMLNVPFPTMPKVHSIFYPQIIANNAVGCDRRCMCQKSYSCLMKSWLPQWTRYLVLASLFLLRHYSVCFRTSKQQHHPSNVNNLQTESSG
jgi:hypothetical protein